MFFGSAAFMGDEFGHSSHYRDNTTSIPTNYDGKDKKKKKTIFHYIISDIYLFSALVYGFWIMAGVIWYKFYSNWTWSTAYYYTIEAGLSIGFCYPAEKDDWSKLFTIFYVLIGSSVVSGCLGVLAATLSSTKVSIVTVKHGFGAISYKEDGKITLNSITQFLWYHLKYFSGWYHNRPRTITIIAFVIWMGLGTAYGMAVEDWSFITSLYWAITSSSTGGLQSAPCVSGTDTTCDMGDMRGAVMGVFMMIGVPLYAATISHFARLAVSKAMVAREEEMINRPIEDAEFIFAANILSPQGSTTLVLGEYILLELMRLGATNQKQIEFLKKKFYELDREKRGELDLEDLQMTGKVVPRKLSSVEMARRLRSRSLELFGFESPTKSHNTISHERSIELSSTDNVSSVKAEVHPSKMKSIFENQSQYSDYSRDNRASETLSRRVDSFSGFDFNIEDEDHNELEDPKSSQLNIPPSKDESFGLDIGDGSSGDEEEDYVPSTFLEKRSGSGELENINSQSRGSFVDV